MRYLDLLKSKDIVIGQVSNEELDCILQEGIPIVLCNNYGMSIKRSLVLSNCGLKPKDVTRLFEIVAKFCDMKYLDKPIEGGPVIVTYKSYADAIEFTKVWKTLFDLDYSSRYTSETKDVAREQMENAVKFVLYCEEYYGSFNSDINVYFSDKSYDVAKYFYIREGVLRGERIFVKDIDRICDTLQVSYCVDSCEGVTMASSELIANKDIYFMEYPSDTDVTLIVNFPEIGGGRTLYTNIVKFAIINKVRLVIVAKEMQKEVFKDLTLEEITGAINIVNP